MKKAAAQLLVSVRNADEAAWALAAGVPWIDLKNPASGPLGRPSVETARQTASVLADHGQRSVALGELTELNLDSNLEAIKRLADWFPVLKIGLANAAEAKGIPGNWRDQLAELQQTLRNRNSALVPVIYADWKNCGAPAPGQVLDVAVQLATPYVLIDTFCKNGRTVFDWMALEDVQKCIDALMGRDCRIVLAGSITEQERARASVLPVAAIGVRGAVCTGSRDSVICPNKLESWMNWFCSA